MVPFSQHEGRLLDPSAKNLEWASQGGKISLPWLKTMKAFLDPNSHPLTGSNDHYCLCDMLHERNSKDPKDGLLRLGLVPELAGRVNSQVAEQDWSSQSWRRTTTSWICSVRHVFTMWNIIHHYNQRKNKKVMEDLKKLVSPDVELTLNEHGRILPLTRECGDPSPTIEFNPNIPPQLFTPVILTSEMQFGDHHREEWCNSTLPTLRMAA